MNHAPAAPGPTGLYDPTTEHDACGVALVAKLWGEATHAVIEKGLEALGNLEHRGAAGADPNTGDGAGILLQIPDAFFRGAVAGVELPDAGRYAVGVIFFEMLTGQLPFDAPDIPTFFIKHLKEPPASPRRSGSVCAH